MNTRKVREHVAAHLAIRDVLDRYTNAVNQRDWPALAALFTADAVWDAGGPDLGPRGFRFEGGEHCVRGIEALVSGTELCVQTNHAVVIDVRDAAATATSTIQEFVRVTDAPGLVTSLGTYYDLLRLEDDAKWRFERRTFRYTWIDANGPAGELLTRFPLARRPG